MVHMSLRKESILNSAFVYYRFEISAPGWKSGFSGGFIGWLGWSYQPEIIGAAKKSK